MPVSTSLSSHFPLGLEHRTACLRTAAWFIVPVPVQSVQSIVPYPLITPPFSDPSLFPKPFPANTHPVLVTAGFLNDIRQFSLQIQSLLSASIVIPFTDRLKDGKTPFSYPVRNFIGGVNGRDVNAVVPTLVGTAQGTNIFVASFTPNDAPYGALASDPNEFVAQVRQVILPNPLSGPGIAPAAVDLNFVSASEPQYTERTFRALINQPSILTNTKCQRNMYYFNQTFSDPVLRTGTATLYGPARGGVLPAALDKRYEGQGGLSASSVTVGFNVEDCEVAAANIDPNA
ncbi:hypothetical protein EPUS_03404 [Endocarpon pusillum Z07020]|uniref:Uncharacterized protein n=1 Tax=Endocarpon pusillum (strain Z07020 / HMAS-L-300199) TaxID=1263415 RepID=U1HXP1_ENDPU|nr:uncharacterized protein EPUS_03404 [Endocarpon pusillum Z07020]ERF74214.1 hypothetical protein EPUS_03404 [Endocarpon pusillum Z07020]